MNRVDVLQCGRTEYRACWEMQRTVAAQTAQHLAADTLMLTEHHPVYTFGTSSNANHLLATAEELNSLCADVVQTDRGGDVTYHGPGQMVAYPILNLEHYRTDLHWYLRQLEEVVLRTLGLFGINGERSPAYTGVWVRGEKICAIGVKCSRWITMHGLALNVTTDLRFFDRIIPCGIFERGVTSMEKVLGGGPSLAEVSEAFIREFGSVFNAEIGGAAVSNQGVYGETIERTTS